MTLQLSGSPLQVAEAEKREAERRRGLERAAGGARQRGEQLDSLQQDKAGELKRVS